MKLEQRHWIFLGLIIVVVGAMLINIELDIKVSPQTQKLYNYIDNLPDNSVLMVSFDHEASSLPEIRPLALSVLRHAFAKWHKLIAVSLLAEGTGIGYRLMQQVGKNYGRVYGQDYVYLGFKPQYIAAILSMGESIPKTYPEDYAGNNYQNLDLVKNVNNYDDITAVISITDGSMTTHWVEYAAARYDIEIVAAVTAAMVTTYDPYLASDQMKAMMGGLRGAAEYEKLIRIGGSGRRGMLAQTSAHLYVILLIVIGNIIYFRSRKKRR